MDNEFKTRLKEAASKAFDAEFRDLLCNSVQKHILEGGKIGWIAGPNCKCPEGCLPGLMSHTLPGPANRLYPFTMQQHISFQTAFDKGFDPEVSYENPERALGLLYRERFYPNGLPIQE